MLEQLFGSKTRIKILRLFFRNKDKTFFVREISRQISIQINAVRRELELLSSLKIIKEVENSSNEEKENEIGEKLRKYYCLNTESIIFEELKELLLKENVMGEQELVSNLKSKAGKIDLLVLTGRFTGVEKIETDLLLVGDVKLRNVKKIIEEYEKKLGFEIRYTVMNKNEFIDRRYVMDKFIYSIFEVENVIIVNDLGI
jgi:Fe2+ or Zn2+ uptake regulation protein